MWRTLSTHHRNQRPFSSKISWISSARIRHQDFYSCPGAGCPGNRGVPRRPSGARWKVHSVDFQSDLWWIKVVVARGWFENCWKSSFYHGVPVKFKEHYNQCFNVGKWNWMGHFLSNTKIFQLIVLRISGKPQENYFFGVVCMLLSCRFSLESIPWNSLAVQAWRPRRHARGPHLKPVLCGAAAELQRPRVGMWCPPVMFAGS